MNNRLDELRKKILADKDAVIAYYEQRVIKLENCLQVWIDSDREEPNYEDYDGES